MESGESDTWEKRPHTECTETQSFLEHRGELTLAERTQRRIRRRVSFPDPS